MFSFKNFLAGKQTAKDKVDAAKAIQSDLDKLMTGHDRSDRQSNNISYTFKNKVDIKEADVKQISQKYKVTYKSDNSGGAMGIGLNFKTCAVAFIVMQQYVQIRFVFNKGIEVVDEKELDAAKKLMKDLRGLF